jgi:hypothetical protein
MRVVIDSNRVQTDELAAFLRASNSNRAVVTDWLMMEAYKGDTLASIYKSLGVLASFPRQVVVLKNTGQCMTVPVGPQMANRLIWRQHTDEFLQFVSEIEQARGGDRLVEESVLWRGAKADERMADAERSARWTVDLFADLINLLEPQDVATIVGKSNPSSGMIGRLVSIAHVIADGYRAQVVNASRKPSDRDITQDFLFRVGVAMTSWFLEWVRTGKQTQTRSDRLRNDYVDAMLSVFGTYFNGVMSGDSKLLKLDKMNHALLRAMGVSLPPEYKLPQNF